MTNNQRYKEIGCDNSTLDLFNQSITQVNTNCGFFLISNWKSVKDWVCMCILFVRIVFQVFPVFQATLDTNT